MKKNKIILFFIGLSLMVGVLVSNILSFNINDAYAKNDVQQISQIFTSQVDNGPFDNEYTDSDEPHGVLIDKYITDYYATTVEKGTVVKEGEVERKDCLFVLGDDPIINIIPRAFFSTYGTRLYVGKEYGFIIDSFYVENSDGKHSIVMVFDISYNDNMIDTKNHLSVQIKPLFQREYLYFTSDDEEFTTRCLNYDYSYRDYYEGSLLLEKRDSTQSNYVVAIPSYINSSYRFIEIEKYYLKDISSQVSLYNENHLNPYEKGYNPQYDDGAFFTQLDYGYKGRFYKQSETKWQDVGSVAFSLATTALDIALNVVPGGGTLNSVLKTTASTLSGFDLVMGIDQIEDSLKKTLISTEKTLTYEPYYNNKELQIEKYGVLTKDAIMSTRKAEDYELLIGTDDNVEFDYQISHTNMDWETRYAVSIFMDAVTLDGDLIRSRTYSYSDKLELEREQEIFEIEENSLHNACLLPNGTSKMRFNSEYDGYYTIHADTSEDIDIKLYRKDINGQEFLQNLDNGQAVFLEGGEEYHLYVSFAYPDGVPPEGWKYGIVPIKYEFTLKELALNSSQSDSFSNFETQIYSFTPEETSNYIISLLDYSGFNLEVYEKGGSGEPVYNNAVEALLNEGITYYIKCNNLVNSNNENTLLIEKGRSINPNTTNILDFKDNQTIYLKADIPFNGNYNVLTNNSNIAVEKYDSDGNLITGEFLKEVCYLKLTNNSIERQINVEFILEFNPSKVEFGSNESEEYIKFVPVSTNTYQLSCDNSINEIFDYNLNPVEYDDIANKAYLEEGKTYYIHTGGNTGYININVDAIELNQIEDQKSVISDSKGFAYFSTDITYAGNRNIISGGSVNIYNDKMQLLYSNRAYMNMASGRYYFSVNTTPNTEVSLGMYYDANTLYADTQHTLSNSGISMFRFVPNSTESYRIFTIGSIYNDLKSKITIYSFNGQELEFFAEIGSGLTDQYVSIEKVLTAGNIYYIKVELAEAQNQTLIFAAFYVNEESHENGTEEVVLHEDKSGLIKTIDMNGSVVIMFNPMIDGKYNFYLDIKYSTDNYLVDVITNGIKNRAIKPNLLDSGEVLEYTIEVFKGNLYYIVITSQNNVSRDVEFKIKPYYDDIKIKYFIEGSNEIIDPNGNDIKVAPGIKINLCLMNGNEEINYDPSYTLDFNENAILVYNNLTFKDIIDSNKTITLSTDYYYRTYNIKFRVVNPFTAESSINYLYDKDSVIYALKVSYDSEVHHNGTLNANMVLKKDGTIVEQSNNNVLVHENNYYIKNIDFNSYIMTEFTKVETTITYSSNGYSFSFDINKEINNKNILLSSYTDDQINDRELVYIQGGETSQNISKTITTPNSVKILILKGYEDITYSNLNIVVNASSNPLLIIASNFNFSANGKIAIESVERDLVLRSAGAVSITGGSGISDGSNGFEALKVKDLKVLGNAYIAINGGYGANGSTEGGKGGAGANGITASGTVIINIPSLVIFGGSGGFGGEGRFNGSGTNGTDHTETTSLSAGGSGSDGGAGGAGGNGGHGIQAHKIIFIGESSIYIFGGDGGDGGNGARGGNGGKGGSDLYRQDMTNAQKGGNGGNGGRGGDGGNGGIGGNALNVLVIDLEDCSNKINLVGGLGGDGGSSSCGGLGGNGGAGGNGNSKAYQMGAQRNGADGGNGGNGGAGGNGGIGGAGGLACNIQVDNNFIFRNGNMGREGYKGYGNLGGEGGAGGKGGGSPWGGKAGKNGTSGSKGIDGIGR